MEKLKDLPNFKAILFRDAGLGVTSSTSRLQVKMMTSIGTIFAEEGLAITFTIDQKQVDFMVFVPLI